MHNKMNVIVMFLLIMLSFAIISEVSAASQADADGTGFDPNIKHDVSSERIEVQNHVDDFKSHNEQNSFNKSMENFQDDKRNENLYEHGDMNNQTPNDRLEEFNQEDSFGHFNQSQRDVPQDKPLNDNGFNKSQVNDMVPKDGINMSEHRDMKPMGDFNVSSDKFNSPNDLRNNMSFDVPHGKELMDDIISKLIGLNNISPNIKKDEKIPYKNNASNNALAPQIPGEKNSSDMWTKSINKNNNLPKQLKKTNKKVKITKKSKGLKKVNKKLPKKFKKERAKR